ncbi:manganese efflux pump MntP [Segatella paludivivens]|uniref:manganese efflux pump MntP n=1 Tax=Segatella paludivivens TaxID=185294 RepID=UPI0003775702|nr:manganese efflux pump MntP family protein [Segatella paludivivens]
MNQLDIWFLALALAMDCFAVSIASGIIVKKHIGKMMIRMAFLFGFFQAAMPLIGWFGVSTFTSYIENVDHWIAFGLLTFLGGRMIRESFLPEEEKKIKPRKLKTQVVLAIATSIDALAVGISFACTGFSNLRMLICPLLIIGFVSFVMSIIGVLLGVRFGKPIAKKLKPELLGGFILIFIGIKVLLSHLYGL